MIGTQVGNYRILAKLGEGGMGVVYKAIDTTLDRVVALKSLSAELAHNPELEQRFRAEAKAQATLNHTNICTLHAFFVENGMAYMVMEYIEGESIAAMIQRRGPIPAQEAIPIFRQALLGIGYAHRKGIVHRDIKPQNIMVDSSGIVKVMDFGIAKVMGGRGMTRTGTQMGTAYYMSPEQVLNKGVDIRSDIYSLGVTLYEILTANVPFTGDSDFQIMSAHLNTPPPLPSRLFPYIPKGVENAVLTAMAKNPDERFQTVEEFGAALEHPLDFTSTVPAFAPPARTMPGTPPPGVPSYNAPTIASPFGTQPPAAPTPFPTPPPGTMPPMPQPPAQPPIQPMMTPPPVAPAALTRSNKLVLAGLGGFLLVCVAVGGWLIFRPKPLPPDKPKDVAQQQAAQLPGASNQPAASQPQSDQDLAAAAVEALKQSGASPQPHAQAPQKPAVQAKNEPPARVEQPPVYTPPAPQVQTPPAVQTPVAPAPGGRITVPAGARVVVRTLDTLLGSARRGDRLRASVVAPVDVGGSIAIPRGADATLRLVDLVRRGPNDPHPELVLELVAVSFNGRLYGVTSDSYTRQGTGLGKQTGDAVREAGSKVAGVFRRRKGEPEPDASVIELLPPDTRVTFTLQSPLSVFQ